MHWERAALCSCCVAIGVGCGFDSAGTGDAGKLSAGGVSQQNSSIGSWVAQGGAASGTGGTARLTTTFSPNTVASGGTVLESSRSILGGSGGTPLGRGTGGTPSSSETFATGGASASTSSSSAFASGGATASTSSSDGTSSASGGSQASSDPNGGSGGNSANGGSTNSSTANCVVSAPNLRCSTDADCCVVSDTCKTKLTLVSHSSLASPYVCNEQGTTQDCKSCTLPAVQVSCRQGQCTGQLVSRALARPAMRKEHCGPFTGPGEALVDALVSPGAAESGQTTFECSSD